MIEYTEYTKMLIGLVAIVNPVGAIPIYISLTSEYDKTERSTISRAVVISVIAILLSSLIAGEIILNFFGITISSFRVAGGILILLMAISMMHAKTSAVIRSKEEESESKDSIAVVPLAIPLLAGPGSISTVILYAHKDTGITHYLLVSLVILTTSFVLYLTLKSIPYLSKYLSQTGINVFTRIMGLVLAAIAIEFISNGLKGLFPSLAW